MRSGDVSLLRVPDRKAVSGIRNRKTWPFYGTRKVGMIMSKSCSLIEYSSVHLGCELESAMTHLWRAYYVLGWYSVSKECF
jgi:hypothetical protein